MSQMEERAPARNHVTDAARRQDADKDSTLKYEWKETFTVSDRSRPRDSQTVRARERSRSRDRWSAWAPETVPPASPLRSRGSTCLGVDGELLENWVKVDQFLREVRAMEALNDPNVLSSLQSGIAEFYLHIVMPRMKQDLDTRRRAIPVRPPDVWSESECRPYVLRISRGVERIHRAGIMQRDLKVVSQPQWGRERGGPRMQFDMLLSAQPPASSF
uniref:Protein kinase domain-containing protein n=1 Tax=Chromera velia CCMP2878 TaxID=1169474 RepID=A0A0G4I0I4_9ALVE|eukprot:Cvel_9920.t1-p1 / transcript=Cvel_9920.t1 / gene=Cvel_9920 / organism=Chromera_velia_CCMP2878 / gene_product=hypothetical protein / transcript_product=hypothetical protein / location=Cvel_scaffold586:23652-24638(+) / protein_length=216 / sequence_SO=supercontig / SO=protein_coding / is_pseudo=false